MLVNTVEHLTKQQANQPTGDWIVEGMFRTHRKRPNLILGLPEAGKSTLARQLAVAVAKGEPFLGRPTKQSKVVYWQSEESQQDLCEDFTIAGALPNNPVIITPEFEPNNSLALASYLKDNPTDLVIIETFDSFLHVKDIKENNDARDSLEAFDKLLASQFPETVFICLHWLNKSDKQHSLTITKILGGTVIAGMTDTKVYIRQVSDTDTRRIITVKTRKGDNIEDTFLDYDPDTHVSTLAETVAQAKQDNNNTLLQLNEVILTGQVQEVVRNHPGISQQEIIAKVPRQAIKVRNALNSLIERGEVERQKDTLTNNKGTYRHYLNNVVPLSMQEGVTV